MARWLTTMTLAVALLGAAALPAQAVTVNQGLTPGVLNTLEDQNREAYIDVDGDGLISVGDVFIGFVRLDDFLPQGVSADNQVYGIFSQQIEAISGQFVQLGPTTAAGLTLSALTGMAIDGDGIAALFDFAADPGVNLIQSPGDTGAVDIFDLFDFITTGSTLRLVAGFREADDFFTVNITNPLVAPGGANAGIPTVPASVTVGLFDAGLSILFNNTNFDFAEAVASLNPWPLIPPVITTHQLAIAAGTLRGAAGDGNEAIFTNAPGFTQCSSVAGSIPCGFTTDADFFVFPVQEQVPAPASLALIGLGLIGAAAAGFVRRKR